MGMNCKKPNALTKWKEKEKHVVYILNGLVCFCVSVFSFCFWEAIT
jgi:hypothetical protein